ncbi:MAG: PAS domain-containing protein [bacterium]|nr:PAS domain-containing protein [bacterium]
MTTSNLPPTELLFDALEDLLFLTDSQGTVTQANPAALAFLGLGAEQACGQDFAQLLGLKPGLFEACLLPEFKGTELRLKQGQEHILFTCHCKSLGESWLIQLHQDDGPARWRLQEAQRLAKVGTWYLDLTLNQLHWSDELFRLTDLDPKRDLPLSVDQLLERVHPEDRNQMLERSLRLLSATQDEPLPPISHRILKADGSYLRCNLTTKIHFDPQGVRVGISGAVQDISDQEALHLSQARLSRAQAIAHFGYWRWEAGDEVYQWSEEMYRIFGLDPAHFEPRPEALGALLAGPDSGSLAALLDPASLNQAGHFELDLAIKQSSGARKQILVRGEALADPQGQVRAVEGVMLDVTQQKQTEATLREREAQWIQAQHIAHFGSWHWDLIADQITWSEEVFRIFGQPADFVPTYAAYKAQVHPLDRESVDQAVQKTLREHQPFRVEHRILLPDGSQRDVLEQGEVTYDDQGRAVSFMGVSQDITERKEAERRLKLHDWELNRAQQVAQFGSWSKGVRGGELRWSEEFYRICGIDRNQKPDSAYFRSLIHEEDRHYISELADQMESEVRSAAEVFRLIRPDGQLIYLRSQLEQDLSETGQPLRLFGVIQDITAQKEAQAQLLESRKNLAEAQSVAHVGSYLFELKTGKLIWSDEFFRLFGFEPGEVEPSHELYYERVHPEDREWLAKISAEALTGQQTHSELVHRVLLPDGTLRYLQLRGRVEFEQGQAIKTWGTAQDITDLKVKERELQESRELLELAQSMSHLGSWIIEMPSMKSIWSSQMRTVLGLGPEVEPSLEAFFEVLHPEDTQNVKEYFEKSLADPEFRKDVEIRLRRPQGKWAYGYLRGRVVFEEGQPVRAIGSLQDITDLKELEVRYRLVSGHLHDLIYRYRLDPPGFEYVSPSSTQLTGYTPEEHYADPKLGYKLVHPDDRHLLERLNHPDPDVLSEPITFRWVRKDGGVFHCEQRNAPVYDDAGRLVAIEGVARDVSAQMEYEEKLRENERKYYQMFNTNQAVKLLIDPSSGQIVEANQAACHFYGYPMERLTQMSITELNQLSAEEVRAEMERARSEQRLYFQFRHRLANGEIRDVEVYSGPVEMRDRTLLYSIVHDVTERNQARARLEEAKQLAEQASKAKGEFLANVSHEIRTPLNAVLGFAELLDPIVVRPEARTYLSSIRTAGESLLSLINDILDLSKIESGMVSVQAQPTDLSALVAEMAEIYRNVSERKGLAFSCRTVGDFPARLRFDQNKLRQVMINLIGNALKFTEAGGVEVALSAERQSPERYRLVLVVKDSGIGIDPSQQEAVFESFRQQEGQSDRRYGGTGLGLTIVKRLTQLLGGEILLDSQVGEGTSFELRFENIESVPEEPVSSSAAISEVVSLKGTKVLIVDDNNSNLALLRAALNKKGLTPSEASDGAEAIELALALEPDCILMDLFMPGMDGFTACERLKADPKTAHIPILAVTASKTEEVAVRVEQLGFDGIFYKPVKIKELLSALAEQVGQKPESKAPPAPADWPSEAEFWRELKERLGEPLAQLGGAIELEVVSQLVRAFEEVAGKWRGDRLLLELETLKKAYSSFDLNELTAWTKRLSQELHNRGE